MTVVRIDIHIEANSAREAHEELEQVVSKYGFVRQDDSASRRYFRLLDALRAADVDVEALTQEYEALMERKFAALHGAKFTPT